LRQVAAVETDEAPIQQRIEIALPNCARLYYDSCGQINQHNRRRADDLKIEKKIGTHDWSKRVNFTIEAMIVVDAYLAYIGATQPHLPQREKETFNEFIHKLADEMIEWQDTTRQARAASFFSPRKRTATQAGLIYLTPTKRRRPKPSSDLSTSSASSGPMPRLPITCKQCHKHKSTKVCSECMKETHICDYKWGRTCFQDHCNEHHPGEPFQESTTMDG
jgi:hypothetical protein